MVPISPARCSGMLRSLTAPGRQPGGGFTRLAFSKEEAEAHRRLRTTFKDAPFQVWNDAIGNTFVMLPGGDPSLPPLLLGSHLDTVPNGGELDGALGVAIGAEILLALKASGIALRRSIILVAFVGEESSRFSMGCLGSRWFTGVLDVDQFLKRPESASGRRAADVLREAGVDLENLHRSNTFTGPFHGFLEIHISQGPLPEPGSRTVGLVGAIAAPQRFEVKIDGAAAHSGTCPMRLRLDALVASAQLVLAVRNAALSEANDASVATVGNLVVPDGSMNVVPGTVELCIDIRDVDAQRRDRVRRRIFAALDEIRTSGFLLEVDQVQCGDPVPLSPNLLALAAQVAGEVGISTARMDSGAGHDAMFLQERGIETGLLFIPSVDGVSHNPKEFSKPEDIEAGLKLLAAMVHKLAL